MRRTLPLLLAVAGCAETVPEVTCEFEFPSAGTALSAQGGFNLQGTVTGTFDPADLPAVRFYSDVEAAAGTYPEGQLFESGIGAEESGCPSGCLAGGRFEGAITPGAHTLRMAALTPGAQVACEATREVVVNSPPSVLSVTFDPAAPTGADDVRFVAETSDADGDAVSLGATWENAAGDSIQGEVLAALDTEAGELWTLRLRPRDPLDTGVEFTATVTIGNTAPGTPQVEIWPTLPGDHQDIHCGVTNLEGLDPDGQVLTTNYSWTVDGAASPVTGDTVPAAETSQGDRWICTATVLDGTAEASASSAEAVVRVARVVPAEVPLDGEGMIVGAVPGMAIGAANGAGSPGDVDGDTLGEVAWVSNDLVVTLAGDGPAFLYLDWGGTSLAGSTAAADVVLRGPEGRYLQAPRFVGDLNGDGLDDLVVPFRHATLPTTVDGSGVYLVFGDAVRWTGTVDLDDVGVRIIGGGTLLGQQPCRLGDLDGDGYDELGLTAPGNDGGTGVLWAVYGHPGAWPGDQSPDHLLPAFHVVGAAAGQNLGSACAGGVDFDGDGTDDFAVGAPTGGPQGKGRVLVFLSEGGRRTGSVTSASADLIIDGDASGAGGFGIALAALPDFDGDGAGDLAVGGLGSSSSAAMAGGLWLVSGGTSLPTGPVAAADLPMRIAGAQGTVGGDPAGLGFCAQIAVGDLDGDGLSDLVCGDLRPHFGADLGGDVGSRVFFGVIGGFDTEASWLDADLVLEALDDADGIGACVAVVPSFGAQGFDAALLGAPGHDGGGADAGAIHVLSF